MLATAKKVTRTAQLKKSSKVSYSRCKCTGKAFQKFPCVCYLESSRKLESNPFFMMEMEVRGLMPNNRIDTNTQVNIVMGQVYQHFVHEASYKIC